MDKKVNIKNTIQYICSILKFFGIHYITKEDFRLAKFNKHKSPDVITRKFLILQKLVFLLLDLIYLQLSDFRISFNRQASLQKERNLRQAQLFVMYYLDKHKSPFIKEIDNQLKVVDFGNSRNIILMVSWMIIEIDLFKMYDQKRLSSIKNQVKEQLNNLAIENSEKFQQKQSKQKQSTKGYITISESFVFFSSSIQQLQNEIDNIVSSYKEFQFYAKKNKQILKKIQSKQGKFIDQIMTSNSDMSIKHFLNLQGQDFIQKKILIYDNSIKIIEKDISQLPLREFFWQWMESIILEDRKSCINDPDYGFAENKLSFGIQKQNSNKDNQISNIIEEFKQITSKYEKHQQSMEEFKKMWMQQSKMLKNPKYQQSLQYLKQNTENIIINMESQYPSYNQVHDFLEKQTNLQNSQQNNKFNLLEEIAKQMLQDPNKNSQQLNKENFNSKQNKLYEKEIQRMQLQISKVRERSHKVLQELFEIINKQYVIYPKI